LVEFQHQGSPRVHQSGSGPDVAVIIPIYNTAEFLRECVDSVLSQSYANLEVILIDDGSTDGSASICDEYQRSDVRVHVVHQLNAGLSEARNAGMRSASAGRVLFLDSDDWLAPECIEELHRMLVDGRAQIAVCGTARLTKPSDALEVRVPTWESRCLTGDDFLRDPARFEPVHPVSACGKLIDRALLEGIWFPRGRFHEDVFVTHVILHRAERIAVTPRILHYYRQRPGSITAGTMSLKSAADKARAHLQRACDFEGYGLSEVAGLEFRRGFGWHLRVAAAVRRAFPAASSDDLRGEMSEQRAVIAGGRHRISLDNRTRLAVGVYSLAPRCVSSLYSAVSGRGNRTHRIEGEIDSS